MLKFFLLFIIIKGNFVLSTSPITPEWNEIIDTKGITDDILAREITTLSTEIQKNRSQNLHLHLISEYYKKRLKKEEKKTTTEIEYLTQTQQTIANNIETKTKINKIGNLQKVENLKSNQQIKEDFISKLLQKRQVTTDTIKSIKEQEINKLIAKNESIENILNLLQEQIKKISADLETIEELENKEKTTTTEENLSIMEEFSFEEIIKNLIKLQQDEAAEITQNTRRLKDEKDNREKNEEATKANDENLEIFSIFLEQYLAEMEKERKVESPNMEDLEEIIKNLKTFSILQELSKKVDSINNDTKNEDMENILKILEEELKNLEIQKDPDDYQYLLMIIDNLINLYGINKTEKIIQRKNPVESENVSERYQMFLELMKEIGKGDASSNIQTTSISILNKSEEFQRRIMEDQLFSYKNPNDTKIKNISKTEEPTSKPPVQNENIFEEIFKELNEIKDSIEKCKSKGNIQQEIFEIKASKDMTIEELINIYRKQLEDCENYQLTINSELKNSSALAETEQFNQDNNYHRRNLEQPNRKMQLNLNAQVNDNLDAPITSAIPITSTAQITRATPTSIISTTPIMSEAPITSTIPIISAIPIMSTTQITRATPTRIISATPIMSDAPVTSAIPIKSAIPIMSTTQITRPTPTPIISATPITSATLLTSTTPISWVALVTQVKRTRKTRLRRKHGWLNSAPRTSNSNRFWWYDNSRLLFVNKIDNNIWEQLRKRIKKPITSTVL